MVIKPLNDRISKIPPPLSWREVDHSFPFRYPEEHEQWVELKDGRRVLIRPYRPGDATAYATMFERVDPDAIRFRFFAYLKALPDTERRRFEAIDYSRDMNFIANYLHRDRRPEMLGVAGGFLEVEKSSVEFGLMVRSDQQGQGLGKILLTKLAHYARSQGFREIRGVVMVDNEPMLRLVKAVGFQEVIDYQPFAASDEIEVVMDLTPSRLGGARRKR